MQGKGGMCGPLLARRFKLSPPPCGSPAWISDRSDSASPRA